MGGFRRTIKSMFDSEPIVGTISPEEGRSKRMIHMGIPCRRVEADHGKRHFWRLSWPDQGIFVI